MSWNGMMQRANIEQRVRHLEDTEAHLATDQTVFAMQMEIYNLRCQLNQIRQYILLCNRGLRQAEEVSFMSDSTK